MGNKFGRSDSGHSAAGLPSLHCTGAGCGSVGGGLHLRRHALVWGACPGGAADAGLDSPRRRGGTGLRPDVELQAAWFARIREFPEFPLMGGGPEPTVIERLIS
jgi:hypothetical protein